MAALDPLGIAIVSAYLRKTGVETRLITMEDQSKADYASQIEKADAVFVSARQFDRDLAQEVLQTADRLKKISIAGGYGPSFDPEGFSTATARVLGEAEPVLPQLIEDWLSGRSLSPTYDATTLPPFDLDQYVWPDRTIFPRSANPFKQNTQEWQRGCKNRCIFCSPSRMQGGIRFRPPADILAELDNLHLKRGDYVFSVDLNSMVIPKEQLREIFLGLSERGLRWSTEGTVAPLIKDFEINGEKGLLGLMSGVDPKRGGCYSFHYGADDLSSPKVCGSYDKNLNDLEKAVGLFRQFTIPLNLSVIVGLDNHTYPESFFEIAGALTELAPGYTFLHIATPLKGTPWGDRLDRDRKIIDRTSTHYNHRQAVHEPKQMTSKQLQQGYYWLLRTIYSPPMIARSFQRNFSAELFIKNPFLALMVTGIPWQTEAWTSVTELTARGYLDRKVQKEMDAEYQRWKGERANSGNRN